jgi:hypothetical protein
MMCTFSFFVKFCYISIILVFSICVCIILVFVNKQAFWRWRFPNMGIEGVWVSKTDKHQKSYIAIDVFNIMIYSQSGQPIHIYVNLTVTNKQGISALDLQKHIFPSGSSPMKSTFPWMQRHYVNYYKREQLVWNPPTWNSISTPAYTKK